MTRTRSSSTTLIIGGAVAAAAIGVIALVATRGDDAPADAPVERRATPGSSTPTAHAAPAPPAISEDKLVFSIPIKGDPVRGEADALVTVVRASEYMCPFCERSRESFERLLTDYPRDVRIVHKDLAHIHREGPMLAAAACAAHRQGKFWEMDDRLWEAFRQRNVAPDHIEELAGDLGLAMGAYRDDVAGACPRDIDDDERIFKNLGITGVPAYFINGRLIRGAQPYARFKQLVDEELALARARVAGGASRTRYYDEHVVAKGLTIYAMAEAPPP